MNFAVSAASFRAPPCASPPSPRHRPLIISTQIPRPPNDSHRLGTAALRCRSAAGPPPPGDSESKAVLDAFFLGKALAEAMNERLGAAVGEVLSMVGQWQAEQQKQVQDFQDEVLERAKRSKEKAVLEAKEEQVIVSKSAAVAPDSATPPTWYPPRRPNAEDPFQEMLND